MIRAVATHCCDLQDARCNNQLPLFRHVYDSPALMLFIAVICTVKSAAALAQTHS